MRKIKNLSKRDELSITSRIKFSLFTQQQWFSFFHLFTERLLQARILKKEKKIHETIEIDNLTRDVNDSLD
jgi:hypothetical protein